MRHSANNIIEVLIGHAEARPHHTAFIWLNDGENASETWDYAHFLQKVQHLAAQLAPLNLGGQRALLVFSTVQDFTLAFMASLYAGIVPVPVFFAGNKRYQAKLANIMADAQVAAVFTLAAHAKAMEPVLGDYWHQHGVRVVHTDTAAHGPAVALAPSPHPAIAFLQYTSGSTGQPKGVVITHHNLLHNQRVIEHAFTCDFDSVILSWLPFHHDMGLIGNILHSIYIGCSCVMMSPFHFVQQPLRWLKAVHRFRATHSGAPNFAFDLCVNKIAPAALDGLDLSCWRVAFNGAEPIKAATLDRFAALLAPTGFGSHAFFTCYGMAETTLMTTGWKPAHEPPLVVQVPNVAGIGYRLPLCSPTDPDSRTVVSSGTPPPGMHVTIAGPNGQPCGELETGEICVAGGSVTPGYWNRDSAAFFVDYNGQRHLKTGDTGFMYKGCLFVYGRLKEMLVIRGENFYPYDIEQSVAELSAHIEANGVAAFSVQIPDEELVVVVELKRTSLQTADTAALLRAIEQDVADGFGLVPHDIVLTTPLGIPRTSSGKLQRLQCQQLYHENAFQVVARKRAQAAGTSETIDIAALLQQAKAQPDYDHLLAYLTGLVTAKTGHRPGSDATDLTALGIDSLRAMELINTLNNDLGINMDVSAIFEHPTVAALARATEHLLWIKNGSATAGEEIEL